MNRIQHRRSFEPAAAWLTPVSPGEVYVNPVRRDFVVGDADGTPRPFVGVRVFDERSEYALDDFIVHAGEIYRCITPVSPPHAFNPAEWETTIDQAALTAFYDARYAPIAHNHDAAYAALDHNHDTVYAALNHNHDTSYAGVNHNHDTVYGRLANSNQWQAVNTFNDVLQAAGSYVQVAGDLSVGGGSGLFVPDAQLSVRDSGVVTVQARSLTSGQQARMLLMNPDRTWSVYMLGTKFAIADVSGAGDRITVQTTSPEIILTGTVQATVGLLVPKVNFSASESIEVAAAGQPMKFFVGGVEKLGLWPDGAITRDAGGALCRANGGLVVPSFTHATRPSPAANPWTLIAVSNDPLAPLQISNGTTWLKVASPDSSAGSGGESPPGP